VTLYTPVSLSVISHLCSGTATTVSLMVCGRSRLFGSASGYMLSGVQGDWLWFNEQWDDDVLMDDLVYQWNRFDFVFARWDHSATFTNLVRSLMNVPETRRVPSAIFDNFCHCLNPHDGGSRSGGANRHTDRVTPLMSGQVPPHFLFSNTVGTTKGVPTRRVCFLSDCLGTPLWFDSHRYHFFGDMDIFSRNLADRSVYELGVGWVQGNPQIPFGTLRLTPGGRRAHVVGDYVRGEVTLVPLFSSFLENYRTVLADEGDMGMGIPGEEVGQLFEGDIVARR
jgi:hypothetical protein